MVSLSWESCYSPSKVPTRNKRPKQKVINLTEKVKTIFITRCNYPYIPMHPIFFPTNNTNATSISIAPNQLPPRLVHRPVVTSQSSAALAWSRARCTCAPERSGGQKVTVRTALFLFFHFTYAYMYKQKYIYIYTKTVSDTKRLKLANRNL